MDRFAFWLPGKHMQGDNGDQGAERQKRDRLIAGPVIQQRHHGVEHQLKLHSERRCENQ